MLPVYSNPAELEKLAKAKYAVPEFLMMENAAKAMADFILEKASATAGGRVQASVVFYAAKVTMAATAMRLQDFCRTN